VLKTLIITAGGLGKLRPAPGTWGSTPPCIIVFLLVLAGVDSWVWNTVLLGLLVYSCVGCVWLGRWAEKKYQGKDPGVVVIDEVAGMAIALLFIDLSPVETGHWLSGYIGAAVIIGAAFFLFRILDIIKAPPANLMEQFPAGWGILLDDLVSGIYVNILLQLFLRIALPLMT